jgi:hypothetical protein
VVVVLAGALAILPVFFLRPPARPGPPVLLLMATDTITATPANVTVDADFGPHCSPVSWNPEQRMLSVRPEFDLTGAQAILVNRYVPGTANFNWGGGDLVRPTVLVEGGVWRLLGPVDGRTLATLVPSGDNVTVNGTMYSQGAQWSLQFAYDVATVRGPVRVVESLTLENQGIVQTRVVPSDPCA